VLTGEKTNPINLDFKLMAISIADEGVCSAKEAMDMLFSEFLQWNMRVAYNRQERDRYLKSLRRK
jgi:dimeric dUTPase (all-alpha-NTP-PPase superfamily)